MPNHCENKMIVVGNADAIAKFKKECIVAAENETGAELMFDFNSIIPIPAELEDTTSPCEPDPELQAKFGASNWYDWKCINWGTKWGAYDYYMLIDEPEKFSFFFNTAWAPPNTEFVREMAKKYPELEFEIYYFEPGCCFAGCYQGQGDEVMEANYDDGNSEYQRIGVEIFNADWMLEEEEEE